MSAKPVVVPKTEAAPSSVNERLMLNVALKATVGLAASGLISVLALRGSGGRLFLTGLGTGGGLGYAWCQNDMFLKDNKSVELPLSIQTEFDRYWSRAGEMVPNFAKFK
jgi:hypothetical protein